MSIQSNLFSFTKGIQLVTKRYLRKETFVPEVQNTAYFLPPPTSPLCCCLTYAKSEERPCLKDHSVVVERADSNNVQLIRKFLYDNYFSRDPCISGLFMPLDSPFLAYLANKYSNSGDRWLAFEVDKRTNEKTLLGVMVANRKHPWEADVYENWGQLYPNPERLYMYFHAHCYRDPNIFKKYKVPFIYNIDVLATSLQLPSQSLEDSQDLKDLLLQTAMNYSHEMQFPLTQVIATSSHLNDPCKRADMKHEWSMNYDDYIDQWGRSLVSSRPPYEDAVNIYIRSAPPKADATASDQKSIFRRLAVF